MDDRRIFGILLLVLSVALIVFGTDATQSALSLSQRFQSGPSEKAVWLIVVGAILGAFGLVVTMRRRRAH